MNKSAFWEAETIEKAVRFPTGLFDISASLNWAIICSGKVLSPLLSQAIIWTNLVLLANEPLGTNFDDILTRLLKFLFKKWTWKCNQQSGEHFVSASICKYCRVSLYKENINHYIHMDHLSKAGYVVCDIHRVAANSYQYRFLIT